MKKILALLFSTKTTAVMLVIYAVSMACATFVENDYGTPTAKALIYNAKWFELVMLILILNFIGNMQKYQLWKLKKWPILVFHLAFIFIFIGGAITRYISYEGTMHIRQGEKSNEVISEATFFKVQIANAQGETRAYQDVPFTLTSKNIPILLKPFQKDFKAQYDFYGKKVRVKTIDYIPRAQDSVQFSNTGKPILHIVTIGEGGRENVYIEEGSARQVQNATISFNAPMPQAINITIKNGEMSLTSPMMGRRLIMATQEEVAVDGEDKIQQLHLASLYQFPNASFVVPQPPKQGKIIYFEGDKNKNQSSPDLIFMEVSTDKETQNISFYGKKGMTGVQKQVLLDNLLVSVGYGAKIYKTEPFYLKLDEFIMERYPGSNSPSSYESKVSIIDEGKETPYKIYMNHILNYKGYRFFQSSFDQDLKGTILSVNHDFWGTTVTYIGYALLILGMFVTLFWKGTRFWKLNDQLKKISQNKKTYLILLLLSSLLLSSQTIDMHGTEDGKIKKETVIKNSNDTHVHSDGTVHSNNEIYTPEVEPTAENAHNHPKQEKSSSIPATPLDPKIFAESIKIPKEHSDKFGSLLVQSFDGRIEPVNTLALEILRKLHKSNNFYNLDANQFLISISIDPMSWAQVPLIKIGNRGGDELKKRVKADDEGYTTLINLYPAGSDGSPRFILEEDFKKAFAKKPADQSNYDKEVIEINDKLQVMEALIAGLYLRFIPLQNDPNHTWTSWITSDFKENDIALDLIGGYFKSVISAEETGNWGTADKQLQVVSEYQHKWGGQVIPSEAKVKWEIRYNNWDVFFKMMILYAIVGTLLLIVAFAKLFLIKLKTISIFEYILLGIIFLGFIIHGLGLGVRWFVSGHEPWSNGYEAVMFISWIGVLAGFLLYKNRNGFIPAAGCLVAVILMGFAHGGDQMNPQITPLVPVLKSYWLMIHVAVITSSYGFFGLSALIGTVVLLLFIINNKRISHKVEDSIRELTIVNEISLAIGIFLLTIGTFLGGIWANESWGRYWSWDPKETWAFISVIIYAVVLHLRLVPGWRGRYIFNLLSLLAFSSVIMTYFGVNYYLSGLHSYAQGDPVPIPLWVYIVIVIVIILAIVSYILHNRNFKEVKKV
ncbi:c-type cytochrome biogenesis protein CcsB [Apibacter raozihei]|uniref:c-type cytochrome biogenesis protein CcsB n=1 Tax=Apibacter raozihei TaxID=2500547 RepID=UPI000FE30309|nr:c-type cytochrome biogenesis protein CcsB [Apibacter raozihei]